MRLILGIDPGSRITGYGLIEVGLGRTSFVSCGIIRAGDGEMPGRLATIFRGLQEIVQRYQPAEAAVESAFMARNASSALKLGQARGAAIAACACNELLVAEYAPRLVKQAVTGQGGAEKSLVQSMVRRRLELAREPSADAADALAIALCHAQHALAGLPEKAG